MSSTNKVWRPRGVPQNLEEPLSVTPPPGGRMNPQLYRDLFQAKLNNLILSNPAAAKRAMQMSQDSAPSWWAIAESYPPQEWASAIVRADQMMALLQGIQPEGVLMDPPDPPLSFQQILEVLP